MSELQFDKCPFRFAMLELLDAVQLFAAIGVHR